MLTVYSKENCPLCDQAKALLKSKNIEFTEARIDLDLDAREFLVSRGHRSVPQIYEGETLYIKGGLAELREKLKD